MKVEVTVGSPSLIVLTVSMDVKATLNLHLMFRAQEMCESRGDRRPGLSVPYSPYGLSYVKQH